MAVAAAPVNDRAGPVAALAGSYPFDAADLDTGWHSHELHQLEYAVEGVVEVETAGSRHLLPPQQALWLPAGTEHRTTLRRARTVSVFLAPQLVQRRRRFG